MASFFYIDQLAELYEEVQVSGIFPDSKYFVDCIPKADSAEILESYRSAKNTEGFQLRDFIGQYFELPGEADDSYQSAGKPIHEHLDILWDVLTRKPDNRKGTLIPLPYPYVVPGGRFREIYYWDSYFTMLGLKESGRTDLIENMVNNFAYLIDTVGFIPNGNRTYYLGRSQPPFFSLMVSLLMELKGEETLLTYLPQLEREYFFWMRGTLELTEKKTAIQRVVRMPDGSIMNRYWDEYDTPRPEAFSEDLHLAKRSGKKAGEIYRHIRAAAESGWDFSSRWFADEKDMATIETTNIIPVDLNCLMLWLETLLHKGYEKKQNREQQRVMQQRITLRRAAIQTYCWNAEKGFYFDYHFKKKQTTAVYSLAGLFPFFLSIAGPEQAESVAKIMEEKFLQPGGLLTTPAETGQQWDAPNGWAPLQWVAYDGLKKDPYNQDTVAEKIRANWMRNCEKVYAETGKMMEKYNVRDTTRKAGGGEYPNQDGFGWTNGVYLRFLAEKKE